MSFISGYTIDTIANDRTYMSEILIAKIVPTMAMPCFDLCLYARIEGTSTVIMKIGAFSKMPQLKSLYHVSALIKLKKGSTLQSLIACKSNNTRALQATFQRIMKLLSVTTSK